MKYKKQDTLLGARILGDGKHVSTQSKNAKWLGLGNFKQVGIVVKNTERVLDYYEKTLGIQHFDSAVMVADTDKGKAKHKISLAQLGAIQFELIEPLEGKTIHFDFLRQGREGLHHLGFFVDDLDGKTKELQAKGVKIVERGTILGVKYAYLDTAGTSGVIFELLKFG
jgi:catechol 2,3-dioxygenase-like lactoylglutathione lyase family enzyme